VTLTAGTKIAGYVVEGVLGHGGMGIVYEAQQVSLNRRVALKVLSPPLGLDTSFAERFRQEGQLQAAIDHPHIIPVFEAGDSDEGLFIAMRLVRGPTLKDMIISRQLEGGRTLRLLVPIADALDYAHAAGLIHRDVKPQNILVGADDHPFLADFGLTKGLGAVGLTRTGQFVGTIDYVSPEQVRGEAATAASDVYALGAVLYECLTGVVPYPRPSDAAVLYAHMSDPPPAATEHRPELPPALNDVLARAMAKDPAQRHNTASELLAEAERAFGTPARAAITPPAPLKRPEDTGIRPAEAEVPTRAAQARGGPAPEKEAAAPRRREHKADEGAASGRVSRRSTASAPAEPSKAEADARREGEMSGTSDLPPLPDLEPAATFAGYRVVARLARGGMGVVYRASAPDGEDVVLRIVRAPHVAGPRLAAAAQRVAHVDHPALLDVREGGEEHDLLYLVSRFVEGRTLRELIDRGPVGLARVGLVVDQVGAALKALQADGLLHGDVRPEYLLLSDEDGHERVRLTDAGLMAGLATASDPMACREGAGPSDYVAPEVIQADGADGRADVYSLGCVLYEMLTGSVPFPAEGERAKRWAHVGEPAPALSAQRAGLVGDFDEVVRRAMAKEPDDRYSDAPALAAAVGAATVAQRATGGGGATTAPGLRPTVGEETVAAAPALRPGAAPPPPGGQAPVGGGGWGGDGAGAGSGRTHRLWPWAAGLAALVAAAVVAVVLLTSGGGSGSGPPPQRANLAFVPLSKQFDAGGTATVEISRANVAAVTIDAQGLLNGEPHLMHIHAGAQGACPLASAARVHNGVRFIETKDGAPYYGHVKAALTLQGDTTDKSLLDFARFPSTGTIRYRRTFRMSLPTANVIRSGSGVIVLHGIDYNHNGRYDDVLGRGGIPGGDRFYAEQTAPAVCGALSPEKQASASVGGVGRRRHGDQVFVADLRASGPEPTSICALHGASAPGSA
jgi:serine/threonine protein kinase